jgi:hypothetical protein
MSLKVYEAIAAITGELSKIGIAKDSTNEQQHYKFRGIDDVYSTLSPLLAKFKLCILPRVIERTVLERETRNGGALFYTVLKVEFDFVSAEDGSKHTTCTIGEAMDTADKSSNKSMSAAYKYCCFQTFCIPTEGGAANDPDATTHEVVAQTPEPPPAWDGSQKVGFSKGFRTSAWREVPQEFLNWVNEHGTKLALRHREAAALEQRRRYDVAAAELPKDLPESAYTGLPTT